MLIEYGGDGCGFDCVIDFGGCVVCVDVVDVGW